MSTTRMRWYRTLFLTAAVYDIVLGIVFTFFHRQAFDMLGILDEMPSGGYVPLIGTFLFVIGVAYWLIWRSDLWRSRDLIIVGTLYKAAYSGVALWTVLFDEVPHILFAALFGVADTVFLVAMVECLIYLGRHPAPHSVQQRERHLVGA